MKKIAVLGAGVAGLVSAYYLAKKGNKVVILEKENNLGGMASGFKQENWSWYLDKTYHHLFSNDRYILNFAKEIGFEKVFFKKPKTTSLYLSPITNLIHPFNTPLDLLKFPLLNLAQKLRAGLILAFLKFSPFFSFYEKQTAEEFLKKTMGNKAWEVLWQVLFRKKFGKYAGNILASFFWSRIKKRTRDLGYFEGGFQAFIDFSAKTDEKLSIIIKKNYQVEIIIKQRRGFLINGEYFDAVVSTLPTPVLIKLTKGIFPASYLNQLSKLKYLYVHNLILETEKPLLKEIYWLNIMASDFPFTVLVQHTNFIDKKHYAGRHLCYIGNYLEDNHKLLNMNKDKILSYFLPYLKKIIPNYQLQIVNCFLFKSPFAQPIFDNNFLKNKPDFKTPVENFFIANLDMTYPHDRGVNYAVKLGKEVSELI